MKKNLTTGRISSSNKKPDSTVQKESHKYKYKQPVRSALVLKPHCGKSLDAELGKRDRIKYMGNTVKVGKEYKYT